jgi:hypothetical protein
MEFMKLLSGNCGWDGIHEITFWKLWMGWNSWMQILEITP